MSLNLDVVLDQIAAEAELKTGTPPGLTASRYPQVSVSTNYAFITIDYPNGRLPWSPEQDHIIRQWYGRVSRTELARRVNEALHRELKTNKFSRSQASIAIRARVIGVPAYTGDETEVCVAQAAGELGLERHFLDQALTRGELPSWRKGKQRYIKRHYLANWAVKFKERQQTQAEILNALKGEDLISKKEAMALTGLSETHLTRYLKTGVVKAWKLPSLTPGGGRGEWLVQRQSAETLAAARQEGRRQVRELWTDAYQTLQQQNNAQVKQLNHNNPNLGQPDPLTEPKSKYHPGCFTVAQVASHTQLRTREVYAAIRARQVEARAVKRGGRLRYAIAPAEARRYAMAIRNSGHGPFWPDYWPANSLDNHSVFWAIPSSCFGGKLGYDILPHFQPCR